MGELRQNMRCKTGFKEGAPGISKAAASPSGSDQWIWLDPAQVIETQGPAQVAVMVHMESKPLIHPRWARRFCH